MSGVQLPYLPAVLCIGSHKLLVQREQQILADTLCPKLIRYPVTVDSINIGREQQPVFTVINQNGCVFMAGKLINFKLAVAQIQNIPLRHKVNLVACVCARYSVHDSRISACVILGICLYTPLSVNRTYPVAEVNIKSVVVSGCHRPLMIPVIVSQHKNIRFGRNLIDLVNQSGCRIRGHQAVV